jgi:hypothetical protein
MADGFLSQLLVIEAANVSAKLDMSLPLIDSQLPQFCNRTVRKDFRSSFNEGGGEYCLHQFRHLPTMSETAELAQRTGRGLYVLATTLYYPIFLLCCLHEFRQIQK